MSLAWPRHGVDQMCFWEPRNRPKTNMTMENPPFEDVFPIENGDFPMLC